MITKDNLISAYFIDNDRKNIEVLTKSEDGKQVIPNIMPFDETDSKFIELNAIVTLDQLHENTYQKKKEEQKDFEDLAMTIAKKNGLVFDENKMDTKFYPTLVNAIFKNVENEDHLFALKLALFEVGKIRDSKDNEKKKKLRQSKNKIELLKLAIELIG